MNCSDLLRYARPHRAVTLLASVVAVALISALFGDTQLPIPALGASDLPTEVPLRRMLPLLPAVFLAATLNGSMQDQEAVAGPRIYRVRAAYLALTTSATCAMFFLVETLGADIGLGFVFVRSLLIWQGLAIVSGRLLGPQLIWVLPLASAFLLIWQAGDQRNWTTTQVDAPLPWVLAVLAAAAGVIAVAVTKRRGAAMLRRLKLAPTASASRQADST